MSNIEIKDGLVLQDGEQIATIDGNIVKSETAINKQVKGQINKLAGEKCDFQFNDGQDDDDSTDAVDGDEPTPGEGGDIDHKVISYREANWKAERFAELYPEARLKACGYRE